MLLFVFGEDSLPRITEEFMGTALEPIAEIAARYSRPCIHFSVVEDGIPPVGCSYHGGAPDLPVDFAWPHALAENGGIGDTLDFVMQISLSEVRSVCQIDGFPERGQILVFDDGHGTSPLTRSGKLLYLPETPYGLVRGPSRNQESRRVPARQLRLSLGVSLPAIGSLAYREMLEDIEDEGLTFEEAEEEAYLEAAFYDKWPVARMLGHAKCSSAACDPMDECVHIQIREYGLLDHDGELDLEEQLESVPLEWAHLLTVESLVGDGPGNDRLTWGDLFSLQFWLRNEHLEQFAIDEARSSLVP